MAPTAIKTKTGSEMNGQDPVGLRQAKSTIIRIRGLVSSGLDFSEGAIANELCSLLILTSSYIRWCREIKTKRERAIISEGTAIIRVLGTVRYSPPLEFFFSLSEEIGVRFGVFINEDRNTVKLDVTRMSGRLRALGLRGDPNR